MNDNEYWDEATDRAYWDYCAQIEAEIREKDNELITRGEARKLAYEIFNHFMFTDFLEITPADIDKKVDAISAVPHEMTVGEYGRVRNRMCLFHFPFCNGCTVLPERKECGEVIHDCPLWTLRDTDKAVAVVKEWEKEHPKEANDER